MHVTSIEYVNFYFPAALRDEMQFFYSHVLQAQACPTLPSNLLQFHLGTQRIQLTPVPKESGLAPTVRQHVAFNVQGMDRLKQQLTTWDVPFVESHPLAHQQQVLVRDPAGNQLEFLDHAPQHQHADAAEVLA